VTIVKGTFLQIWQRSDADPDPNFLFDADPDPTFLFDADPDPTLQLGQVNN
jgi:hypothetical protein